MGSLTLSLNFSKVNIHIAKIMLVFTYDDGNTWFETEMIKNGEDHHAFLSDIPDEGTLIYFLKIIDVFDEEFIDNNNEQYYSLPYICPLEPKSLQEEPNQDSVPQSEELQKFESGPSETEQSEIIPSDSEMEAINKIENDQSLLINADDMTISSTNGALKSDFETGDESTLVENPLGNQKFDEDEKVVEETADSDEIEANGSESSSNESEILETEVEKAKIIENKEKIDDKTILLNRSPLPQDQIDGKASKENIQSIKPLAPKKIKLPSHGESPEIASKISSQTTPTNIKPQVEIKNNENAAGVFLRGSKKVEKKNKDKEDSPALIPPPSPESATPQFEKSEEPSIPKDQKDLMDKIFALSRYKAKQETEKETSSNISGKGTNKATNMFEKTKLNLAKLDTSKNGDNKNEANGTFNISPLFSMESIPIKIRHPFSTAMYEYISKNGSLLAVQDPKSKKKEEKSNKKPCRKCEAVLNKDWRICPICGAKN